MIALGAAAVLLLSRTSGLRSAEPSVFDLAVERLRSNSAFERQRGEAELLRMGTDGLLLLAVLLENPGDRSIHCRLERVFSELLDAALAELEGEYQALLLDKSEREVLSARVEAAKLRESLRPKIEEWRKKDPRILEKVDDVVRLEELEAREKAGKTVEAAEEIARLRKLRDELRSSLKDFDRVLKETLELERFGGLSASGGVSRDLDLMRIQELDARITERQPKVARLTERLEGLGLPAARGILARRVLGRDRLGSPAQELLERIAEKHRDSLLVEGERFEALRYTRGLLWAWEADRSGAHEEGARKAIARHIELTLKDIEDPDPSLRDRATEELYFLGDRGREALETSLSAGGAQPREKGRFLFHLLRWRIHPKTYARTNIDFRNYERLGFRQRRAMVFDYARTAGEDSIPTLRAIVTDEKLEPSLFVRIGAARALAGFRDMSGREFLLAKHPDLILTRPEVSIGIGLAQGIDLIRDRKYDRGIEELKKVLALSPFDFRAHYHIAFAYLLLKDFAKAIHHFEIARRINDRDQLTLYNLACAYALSGRKAEALGALEAAVEAGFDDADHMESDPDLDSLRDEVAYRRLIERLRNAPRNEPDR